MNAPAIILIRPQMVENIGMVARAMLNCGLTDLRLAAPRDPWPLPDVLASRLAAAASGADAVLENVRIYASTQEAVADVQTVLATTARPRDMVKEVLPPRAAMAEARARSKAGEKVGLMFGPERTGLANEDLQCADKIITIPANPEFSSFNLAQSVLLMAYEWHVAEATAKERVLDYGKSFPAPKKDLNAFFDRLESELEACGFFNNPDMKPAMQQNLRNAFLRAGLSEQEVRTLQGVLTALADGPKRTKKAS